MPDQFVIRLEFIDSMNSSGAFVASIKYLAVSIGDNFSTEIIWAASQRLNESVSNDINSKFFVRAFKL